MYSYVSITSFSSYVLHELDIMAYYCLFYFSYCSAVLEIAEIFKFISDTSYLVLDYNGCKHNCCLNILAILIQGRYGSQRSVKWCIQIVVEQVTSYYSLFERVNKLLLFKHGNEIMAWVSACPDCNKLRYCELLCDLGNGNDHILVFRLVIACSLYNNGYVIRSCTINSL